MWVQDVDWETPPEGEKKASKQALDTVPEPVEGEYTQIPSNGIPYFCHV